jgi:thioredoxin-like negative regulator of GroEL
LPSLAATLLVACSARPIASATPNAGATSRAPAQLDAPSEVPRAASTDTETRAPPIAAKKPLVFIEDDYDGARSEATKRGLPLFVDVWANWCHTCMSLREVVFPDEKLAAVADRFVWLSIDSENSKNEPFLARFPGHTLPTLWVLDPKTETPVLKWIGAATAEELVAVLEDANGPVDGQTNSATALFIQGNRESAVGHAAKAVPLYERALALGSADWPKRPRAIEALTMRFAELGRAKDCLSLSLREAPRMPEGTSRVNVIVNGIEAASLLTPTATTEGALATLRALAEHVAEDPSPAVLVDDRSSLYEALVHTYAATNPKEARRLAVEWAALLEHAAASDVTKEARRTRDPHRLEAYLALGEPERAVPMLEQSEREAPDDENPPARLARAHVAMGQLDQALEDVNRALARCNGPRKLRVYMLQADIFLAKKDAAGARDALERAVKFARESHLPAEYDRLVASIAKKMRALPTGR